MISRQQVIEQARTWLGTPYHHQGRIKGIGVDCIGFIIGALMEVGISNLDRQEFQEYGRCPPRGKGMLKYFDELTISVGYNYKPADLLVFWINDTTKRPQHIAMATDYGIIHTHSSVGKVVENVLDEAWLAKFICAYQVPGVS